MNVYCRIHTGRLAHWECPRCKMGLCPECIIEKEDNSNGPYQDKKYICPKCMLDADWIAPSNGITPIWKRFSDFFAYPFSLFPMLLILFTGVSALLHIREGFFPDLMSFIASIILIKYGLNVLKETAKGSLIPPEINTESILGDISLVLKQFLLYLAMAVFLFLILKTFGLYSFTASAIGLIIFFPAMIIVLATTESFFTAVNPAYFGGLVFRIGIGYLVMYFFLLLLLGAPAALLHYLLPHLEKPLFLFISGTAEAYYTIIGYNLMGYLILQYNKEIGYTIEPENFKSGEKTPIDFHKDKDENSAEKAVLKQAMFHSIDGDHSKALSIVAQHINSYSVKTAELSEYFFNLLKLTKNKERILKYGKKHIQVLLENNEIKKACSTYEFCKANDKNFILPPGLILKLGQGFYGSSQPKKAVTTINQIIKFFPEDPLVPKAYFRIAQILNDSLNENQKVEQILNILTKKYPENEFTDKAVSYLGIGG